MGVEAYLEPETLVSVPGLCLVAFDGEWTRRPVGDVATARQAIQAAQAGGTGAGMQGAGMGAGTGMNQGMSGGQMGGQMGGMDQGMGTPGRGNVGSQGQSTGAQGVGAPVSGTYR